MKKKNVKVLFLDESSLIYNPHDSRLSMSSFWYLFQEQIRRSDVVREFIGCSAVIKSRHFPVFIDYITIASGARVIITE